MGESYHIMEGIPKHKMNSDETEYSHNLRLMFRWRCIQGLLILTSLLPIPILLIGLELSTAYKLSATSLLGALAAYVVRREYRHRASYYYKIKPKETDEAKN